MRPVLLAFLALPTAVNATELCYVSQQGYTVAVPQFAFTAVQPEGWHVKAMFDGVECNVTVVPADVFPSDPGPVARLEALIDEFGVGLEQNDLSQSIERYETATGNAAAVAVLSRDANSLVISTTNLDGNDPVNVFCTAPPARQIMAIEVAISIDHVAPTDMRRCGK